jgi:hypothetical protein
MKQLLPFLVLLAVIAAASLAAYSQVYGLGSTAFVALATLLGLALATALVWSLHALFAHFSQRPAAGAPGTSGYRPQPPGSPSRVLAGVAIGTLVGSVTWAATGWFSGAVLMLVVRFLMKDYLGDFWGDLHWVAWWGGVYFGLAGLVVGAVIGGRAGLRGGPLVIPAVRGSWNTFGMVATAVGAIVALLAAAGTSSSAGDTPGPDTNG